MGVVVLNSSIRKRGFAYYSIFNLERCKALGSINVNDTINYSTQRTVKATQWGPSSHKNKFYIYDYLYPDTDQSKHQNLPLEHQITRKYDTACWFE